MHKSYIVLGASLACLAVVLGAFGAHGLKKLVGAETIITFQTGVQYQMYHAFALLFIGILYQQFAGSMLQYSAWCFIGGIVLFSGSLYLLSFLKAKEMVGLSGIGILTPIGGLFFIAGWVLLILAVLKK